MVFRDDIPTPVCGRDLLFPVLRVGRQGASWCCCTGTWLWLRGVARVLLAWLWAGCSAGGSVHMQREYNHNITIISIYTHPCFGVRHTCARGCRLCVLATGKSVQSRAACSLALSSSTEQAAGHAWPRGCFTCLLVTTHVSSAAKVVCGTRACRGAGYQVAAAEWFHSGQWHCLVSYFGWCMLCFTHLGCCGLLICRAVVRMLAEMVYGLWLATLHRALGDSIPRVFFQQPWFLQ